MRDLPGGLFKNLVDNRARAPVVSLDLTLGRPIRGPVLGSFSNRRIDAELEQVIEFGVETRDVQAVAADLIPIERFQMA